jgi:hypothetical protein
VRALLLVFVLLACGCSARADRVFIAPGFITGSSGPQPGYTVKLVQAKHAPSEVIGDDGSLCRLTAERFAHVEVGDLLACEWTIAPETVQAAIASPAAVASWPAAPAAGQVRISHSFFESPFDSGAHLQRAVAVPDSVRMKVGYQHWRGAALGGALGAVGGLVLAILAHGECSDCTDNDPSVVQVGLVGAGLGGAFGFLVGAASPRYVWVPRASEHPE